MLKALYSFVLNNKQIFKFIISGGSAAATDLLILAFLHDYFKIDVVISGLIAFSISFIISFTLQKFWTFRDKDKENIGQQLFMYLLVGLAGLSVTAFGLDLLVNKFDIYYIFAQIMVGSSLAFFNFLIYKLVIFKKYLKRKNPRILIVTGIYPPEIGGPATIASSLFTELRSQGFNVKIATYGDEEKIKRIHQVSRHQNIVFRYAKMTLLVWKMSVNRDIIYALDMVGVGLPCAIVKILRPRKKFVVRVGGDYQWEQATQNKHWRITTKDFLKKGKNNFTDTKMRKVVDFVLTKADKVIYNSEMLRDLHLKYRGIPATKTAVIKNIVPEQDVAPLPREGEDITILFLGRLVFFKNLQTLLRAYKQLTKKDFGKKIKLKIVGSGPEFHVLEDEIRDTNLGEYVELTAGVDQEETTREYENADIFIAPSLTEINANTVTEFKHFNKPIILTKYSESCYVGEDMAGMHYVDPLDIEDIRDTLKFVIEQVITGETERIDYQDSKIAWPINKVLDAHIELFRNIK